MRSITWSGTHIRYLKGNSTCLWEAESGPNPENYKVVDFRLVWMKENFQGYKWSTAESTTWNDCGFFEEIREDKWLLAEGVACGNG